MKQKKASRYPERDAAICYGFVHGKTMAELADFHDITESRVGQILNREGLAPGRKHQSKGTKDKPPTTPKKPKAPPATLAPEPVAVKPNGSGWEYRAELHSVDSAPCDGSPVLGFVLSPTGHGGDWSSIVLDPNTSPEFWKAAGLLFWMELPASPLIGV